MIRFILKGILRDKNRSLLPIIIISIGVALTVLLSGFLKGVFGDLITTSANFDTGHVKVMTKAYEENIEQLPIDLAILDADELQQELADSYPDLEWVKRTNFGGLIDVLDQDGHSIGQGPAVGIGIEIVDADNGELNRIDIQKALIKGRNITQQGEAILGETFANKIGAEIGTDITYFGSTINGSLSFYNFKVVGTIAFGTSTLDNGAFIVDMRDVQQMLDLIGGSTEILGFWKQGGYQDKASIKLAHSFREKHNDDDEFGPTMLALREQNDLGGILDYTDLIVGLITSIFIFVMSIVLWNTGLLGGLRRFKEFGIRLALGEEKKAIYISQIIEAVIIGIIGSVIGTAIGILIVWYLQKYGLDFGDATTGVKLFIPTVMRAQFTPELLYIGFIPGLFAMVLGTMLSGIGIFRRETASLFKELEV